ncbi:SH3 domain-containing protein [Paraburkholderia tropica]|uniref:SH3 domain-containing protein n=1 Tax=Paraburkholderia tropica TaxID=92647 RepID=UPI001590FC14|nr:SH3 domain-containing protein [Paraburkholderia tropica]
MAQQQEQPSKVEGWAYPFALKTTQPAPAPEDYLKALAVAEDGFYPIGTNGLWHGGIHFGAQTAATFDQDGGVKCIADGEVVAFRLDRKLQELDYPGGIKAGYSKGFTLVRHRLVLPVAPTQPSGSNASQLQQPQNTAPPAEDVLTFFSLYMHTLPLEGYSSSSQGNASKKTLPAYYGSTVTFTVGPSANDPQLKATGEPDSTTKGLRVRASHSAQAEVVAWLPPGTKITVGQKHGKWGRVASYITGAAQPYKQGSSLHAGAANGWVYTGEMVEESNPSAVDQIYILPKPSRVAAGETIAWIGEYQRFVEARAHNTLPPKIGERPLLHVEVFTGDDLNAFIARSRQRAQQLDVKSRALLLISKGAKLVQPASADTSISAGTSIKVASDSPANGPWCKVVKVNATGHPLSGQPPLWIARSDLQGNGDREAWSQFPLQVQSAGGEAAAWSRVVSTGTAPACAEAANKTWYQVSIADANDEQVNGWVCDRGHPLVDLKSPWDWPGFEVATLDASVSVMFERALYVADSGSPDEIARFEDSFDTARSDEVIKRLEDAIDGQEQKDGKITARELQKALGKPWLADRIDHLIVRYESEWGGEMAKWDALDSHMHEGLPVWQAEKTRIGALRYWSGISGLAGWPSSARVYHFHPFGILGNFFDPETCRCGCCLKVTGTRFKVDAHTFWYGPQHAGTISLGACAALATMRANGTLSETEESILRAMSQNEGKVDTVQAIDKAIISAGAMQKTIRGAESKGELATQIAVFRDSHPDAYQRYFAECGWTVSGSGSDASLGYGSSTYTNGVRLTGDELYAALRRDCSADTFGKLVKCPPVAAMAHAVSSPLYLQLQVKDFVDRLNHAIGKKPSGYSYPIRDYLQSPLGRATVLDQDVNAPGATANSIKASLDRFFQNNSLAPRNPADWGANRSTYEASILQDYGPSRYMATVNGQSVAPGRYQHLVQALGMPN